VNPAGKAGFGVQQLGVRGYLRIPEEGKGFLRNESPELVVPGEVQGFGVPVIFHAAVVFHGHAVHDFGYQFQILILVMDFEDAHWVIFPPLDVFHVAPLLSTLRANSELRF
jgi:hypothetical protein